MPGFGGNQSYKYFCPKMSRVSMSMNSSGGLQKLINIYLLKIETKNVKIPVICLTILVI
jgi:hypothetical protein